MTDQEAEKMLKDLESHFRCKVMPVDRYCAIFDQYFQVVAHDYIEKRYPEVAKNLRTIDLIISKSNYLGRRLYGNDDELRKTPCPVHKGHWSGIPFEKTPCGCDLTGWLK